jgi:phosphoribosylformylglycinamidine cyclo-ligase
MYRTFNCGVGMVLCVAEAEAEQAIAALTAAGESAWRIGQIEPADQSAELVVLADA